MTLAAITWLVYAVPAYLLYTVVFRIRYGKSAVAEQFPPRNLYGWIDFALAGCLIGYSVWVVFGAATAEPVSILAGLCFWSAGCLLRIWAVWTLGPHWRIGQDESDGTTEYVRTGPYRIMDHPINSALVLVAIGQALMAGLDARAIFLLGFAVTYLLVQAGAEKAFWRSRTAKPLSGEVQD
jgi:protein-S-isoprenylcysteine O-methyltransferase Ste14